MKVHDFIFSNQTHYRVKRHLAFWLARLLFYFAWQFSIYLIVPLGVRADHLSSFLAFLPIVTCLLLDMFYCYTIAYGIIPRYFMRKKYFSGILILVALSIAILIVGSLFYSGIDNIFAAPPNEVLVVLWMSVLTFLNMGPPIICALFLAIKLLKNWYLKEEEKLALSRETANAELQLLKAQVHPHFLFNTLNNIYSFALKGSKKTEDLVDKLSHVLKYMINDCASPRVPLGKELKMITDYIGLEKVRYGEKLKINIEIDGDPANKFVCPLMMIPFVENSFKHGTSQVLAHPWVKLNINITPTQILFDLSNSKPAAAISVPFKKGIGLSNARKRLQLLYPESHEMAIESQDEIYSVRLKLPIFEQS